MSTIDALQAVLAGEHACVYAYGVIGAHVTDADEPAARSAFETHRARREPLANQLRLRGHEPVAALPAYAVPIAVDDPRTARQLAALVERRLAVAYADLVAITSLAGLRRFAAVALAEGAALAAAWSGETDALPGLDPVPDPAR